MDTVKIARDLCDQIAAEQEDRRLNPQTGKLLHASQSEIAKARQQLSDICTRTRRSFYIVGAVTARDRVRSTACAVVESKPTAPRTA